MKRILAAIDLSGRSDRALQRALALARQFGADLEVIHVVDDGLPDPVRRQIEEASLASMNACLQSLMGDKPETCATRIVAGQDFTGILSRAEEMSADLIVLGIHRHAAREAFRGTTAERVVRFGEIPVLMVKEPVAGPYRRVVVPADLSPHARGLIARGAACAWRRNPRRARDACAVQGLPWPRDASANHT